MPLAMGTLPTVLVVNAVIALVLLAIVPGGTRRVRVATAFAIAVVGGVLLQQWQASPARLPVPPPPPAPPALPALDVPVVRYENGKLIIDALAALRGGPGAASQTAAEAESQPAEERSLTAAVRRDVAEGLAGYFDKLVKEEAPKSTRLRELRSKLRGLSEEQRRALADEAVRLRDVVKGYQGVFAGDGAGAAELHDVAIVRPEEIVALAKAEAKTRRGTEGTIWPGALVAAGIIVAAAAVLKRVVWRAG
jgi:hypothetical protein